MSKISISVEDKAHSAAIRKILLAEYPKLQTRNGYQIYKWIQKNFDEMDWRVIKFWVVKKDCQGYKRGQKILNHSEMSRFIRKGGKVRNIFTFRKETRRKLRELIGCFDVPIAGQVGFTRNRNIFDVAHSIATGIDSINAIVTLDLEDAFDQITENQVKAVIKYVFDVNKTDAERFAKVMCHEGHLFQGNPLAPLIFNIWSSRLIYVCHKCNVDVLQYADDLTIASDFAYVSAHRLDFIHSLIEQLGFRVNPTKTKRQRKQHRFQFLGLYMLDYSDYGGYGIYPQNLRKTRNNLRLWCYLESIGRTDSRRLNKEGKPIKIAEMKNGLGNWLKQCLDQSSRCGLLLYNLG